MVDHVIEHDVVTVLTAGEVLLRVIDDVIRVKGPDQLELPGAAHASDFRTERLGDLHRKRPHASRGSVYENPDPRFDLTHVAQGDQRESDSS